MEEQNNAQIIKEREKEFLRTFPKNANLGDDFDSLIKYGFFHFTNRENLESIEKSGLEPRIGKNSEGFETKKRSYFSIGAIGVLGIANRAIFLKSMELAKLRNASMEDVKQDAFSEIYDIYKDSVFLKLDIEDGVEYDSEDFMTRRNSHTIEDASVHPSKMRMVSVGGEFSPLKLLEMFYENADANSIRRSNIEDGNIEYVEENYLHEFIDFIRTKSREEQRNDSVSETSIETTLPMIDLEEKMVARDSRKSLKKSGLHDALESGIKSSEVKSAESVVIDLVTGKDEKSQNVESQNLGEN